MELDSTSEPLFDTVNDIDSVSENLTSWIYGPNDWVRYMNEEYKPFYEQNVATTNKRIVYEKKGTTGMAGQLFGVCDTLLLGVLHQRVVQCKHHHYL